MPTLRELGIASRGSGRHWTQPCPQCSHSRKKSKDPCLSVAVGPQTLSDGKALDTGFAVYRCHHCGWHGGTDERDEHQRLRDWKPFDKRKGVAGSARTGRGPVRAPRNHKPPKSRWDI